MPYLHIRTNARIDDETALLKRCSASVAEALGKSERFVMLSIDSEQPMSFAGTSEPCAYLELKSLGLEPGQTNSLSATLCELMARELGIAPARVYIEFTPGERALWGWNSGTFAK